MVDFSQIRGAAVPSVDFTTLGNLGKTYREGQMQRARDEALAGAGPGTSLADIGTRLLRAGDMQGGMAFIQAARQQGNDDFQRAEAQRQQSNADRTFAESRRVSDRTFAEAQRTHDPAYVRSINEAKEKPREFGYADVSKLAEEGGKFASVNSFIENFRPEYAGKPFGMGAASNYLARNLPSAMTGETERNAASYWQNYDRYKNVVRNDLFGSALTATEQAAFEKADINPSMNPELITRNLAEQQKILQGAMRRKAGSLVASKYKPEAISEAYGIPIKELGVTQSASAQPSTTRPVRVSSPAEARKLPSGTPIILPDGTPGRVP